MTLATENPILTTEAKPEITIEEGDRKVLDVLPKPVPIDAFLDWYPTDSEFRYELREGVIIQMPMPRGNHSDVAGFINYELIFNIRQNKFPYRFPKECMVKISENTGYKPDVIILDETQLESEPRWKSASTIENGRSIKLIVEVVSTNWRDDYMKKLADYEAMGIQEYWIVDYAGLGGIRFIGTPKQPTLTICSLVDGEYELQLFRGNDAIVSPTFPNLILTANQVFNAD